MRLHPDDGYDEFHAQMWRYFKVLHSTQPSIDETAALFRERRIGAVIFPVDAEREIGFRR